MTHRRRVWIGAVVVVLVGAWLAVGLLPRIGTGPFTRFDLESSESEEDDLPQRTVIDPSDGTYDGTWTFQNTGRLPVTVRLAEPEHERSYLWEATLHAYDALANEVHGAAEALTVAPGGMLAVQFAFGLGCTTTEAGTTTGVSSVDLAVTTLGLTRVIEVRSSETIAVQLTADNVPGPGCTT